MVGGRRASLGGQMLETVIKALTLKAFHECGYQEYHKSRGDLFEHEEQRMLIRNYPYTTIFGTPGRREYYIHSQEWTGELECKFQSGGGSVDEKMLYLAETLRRGSEQRLAIVHGGAYWDREPRGQAIIKWLKAESKVLRQGGKELVVLGLDDFFRWANQTWK